MTSLMHMVVDNYNELINNAKDPLVDSWLFMQSPVPISIIVILYLWFVLSWGPKWMEKREPYQLKTVLIVYNLYNVIFSTWLFTVPFRTQFVNVFNLCHVELPQELRAVFSTGAWWYFFSKIVELLDTVFFVLRKKNSQITFLHVYHHAMMAFFTWMYLKFLPGEQGIFIGLLNSFVHIIMYTYYFIAALGPQYQKYLWWKKYMTWIQLTQFVLMLVYLAYTMAWDCRTPRILTFFFAGNIIIFIYLFSDFYRKSYVKKNAALKEKEAAAAVAAAAALKQNGAAAKLIEATPESDKVK